MHYIPDISPELSRLHEHNRKLCKPISSGCFLLYDLIFLISIIVIVDVYKRQHLPFDKNALAALPFSYIALGHIHKPAVLLENRMAYPGSPEPLDLTETGPHGYLTGEIDDATGHVTSLKFKAAAQAQYIPLVVSEMCIRDSFWTTWEAAHQIMRL